MSCMIVCPAACRNCDITPCADRMAEEDTEGKLHIAAAQAVAMSSTGLSEFFSTGPRVPLTGPNPFDAMARHITNIYEDEIAEPRTQEAMMKVIELEGLKHCGMRSDLSCRHCHETCKIRLAPRRY